MTFASPQDDGARAKPRIGPVVVAGPRDDDPLPSRTTVIPPLFVRSAPPIPAEETQATANPSTPQIVEGSDIGSIPEPSSKSTAAGEDFDSGTYLDELALTGTEGSTVEALDTSMSGLGPTEAISVEGLDDASEAPTADEQIDASEGWSPLPPWLRAVERGLEDDTPVPQADDEAPAIETAAPWSESEPAADTPAQFPTEEAEEAFDAHAEEPLSASEALSYESTEDLRWEPEPSAEDGDSAHHEPEPVEFGTAESADTSLDEPWRQDLEPWESPEPVAGSVSPTAESEATEAADDGPSTVPAPFGDQVEQLARRLEQIAATLRDSGPDSLAGPTSDPFGALIAAYILGSRERSGDSRDST